MSINATEAHAWNKHLNEQFSAISVNYDDTISGHMQYLFHRGFLLGKRIFGYDEMSYQYKKLKASCRHQYRSDTELDKELLRAGCTHLKWAILNLAIVSATLLTCAAIIWLTCSTGGVGTIVLGAGVFTLLNYMAPACGTTFAYLSTIISGMTALSITVSKHGPLQNAAGIMLGIVTAIIGVPIFLAAAAISIPVNIIMGLLLMQIGSCIAFHKFLTHNFDYMHTEQAITTEYENDEVDAMIVVEPIISENTLPEASSLPVAVPTLFVDAVPENVAPWMIEVTDAELLTAHHIPETPTPTQFNPKQGNPF